MNGERGQARRYHWLSEGLTSFLDDPHAAVEGEGQGRIVNLADARAAKSRAAQVALLGEMSPERIAREFARIEASLPGAGAPGAPHPPSASSPRARGEGTAMAGASAGLRGAGLRGEIAAKGAFPSPRLRGEGARRADEGQPSQLELLPHLSMPDHHDVRPGDVVLRRLHGALAAAAECGPRDFAQVLQVPGVGARTVRALALVAEVLHGTPCRFSDPARFSLAHGGKDRHPFPVPTKVMDHTIGVLKSAVRSAKLGREEELLAIRRLDAQARRLEATARGPSLDGYMAEERRRSHQYGGRSVFGWEPAADSSTAASARRRT
jgi:hypothetical protein